MMMPGDLNLEQHMDKQDWKAMEEVLGQKLSGLQQRMRALKIPMVILFEGWGAAGKGSVISRLIHNLDPRGFSVHSMLPPTPDEQRWPWLRRYWCRLPLYGDLVIFDRSWYQQTAIYEADKFSRKERDARYSQALEFERMLVDDGYQVVKFFLHISKKEQRKRFKVLEERKETRWRVTKEDWRHHDRYDACLNEFDRMIEQTDTPETPWTLVEAEDRYFAIHKVVSVVIERMEQAILARETGSKPLFEGIRTTPEICVRPSIRLKEVNPDGILRDEEYRVQLKQCQRRLFELHNRIYQKKIPLILAFEGWDAAGKGGNIKRLTQSLDPRGYEVVPVAAPTFEEKNRHYLWRFWNALPRDGHIAVFDRTWYGRVLVEHVEGFCADEEWARAYDEINRFERQLHDWGAVILKLWLQIDQEEQLRRFEERQSIPAKQYKITDEDWRNREKWSAYETAVDEMLLHTNTAYAPWVVVESNNKKYARIRTMRAVIAALEERL